MKDAEHIHCVSLEDAPTLTRVWIDIGRATDRATARPAACGVAP